MKPFLLILLMIFSTFAHAQDITLQSVSNITQTRAYIYWKSLTSGSSKVVYGTNSTNLNLSVLNSGNRSNHTIVLQPLTNCTTYYYKAQVITAAGAIVDSAVKSFATHGCRGNSTDTFQPSAPSNLRVLSTTSTSVTLEWDPASDANGISGYIISGKNSTSNFGIIATTNGTTTRKVITGLTAATLYSGTIGIASGFAVQAKDPSDNYSNATARLSVTTAKAPAACLNLLTNSSNFSSKLNPTGNPIGGGECYTNQINPLTAHYVAYNKTSFLSALSVAQSGQIIFIPSSVSIDLTGVSNISISGGVTIASDRGYYGSNGGLIFSNSTFPDSASVPLFKTDGANVRLTGLRLRGPNPDHFDHDMDATGVGLLLKNYYPSLEVDNCEIYNWDKWAFYLYVQHDSYIHHNHFHHTRRSGYGYSIWFGGSGSEENGTSIVEANILDSARHNIGSSGHKNSWEARYNVIMHHQMNNCFDRHDYGPDGFGGINTSIHHNLYYSTNYQFGIMFPFSPIGMDLIYENWFTRPLATVGVIDNIQVSTINNPQVQFYSNNFDYLGRNAPTAAITSNISEGTVPLTVQFSGLSSLDNDNGNIKKYVWRFGDGDHTGNEKLGSSVSYTFTQPGVYNVNLIVYNDYGVPSDYAKKTIIVKPSNPNAYVFSGWIKDTYPGNISGRYVNQLVLDDTLVLWEEDVAGNEGWQHVVVDLSPHVSAGQTHKVAFKLKAIADNASIPGVDIVEIYQWYDDIHVFNTNTQNFDFESSSLSPWKTKFTQAPNNPNPVSIGSGVITGEPRSGLKHFYMKFPLDKAVPTGTSAELYQNLIFN